MNEASKKLFALIFNRLSRDGQLFPRYVGEFDGVGGLPKGDYPPIYSWTDTSKELSIRLSFNTPLLEEICYEEAEKAEIGIDPVTLRGALAILREVSTGAFQKILVPEG